MSNRQERRKRKLLNFAPAAIQAKQPDPGTLQGIIGDVLTLIIFAFGPAGLAMDYRTWIAALAVAAALIVWATIAIVKSDHPATYKVIWFWVVFLLLAGVQVISFLNPVEITPGYIRLRSGGAIEEAYVSVKNRSTTDLYSAWVSITPDNTSMDPLSIQIDTEPSQQAPWALFRGAHYGADVLMVAGYHESAPIVLVRFFSIPAGGVRGLHVHSLSTVEGGANISYRGSEREKARIVEFPDKETGKRDLGMSFSLPLSVTTTGVFIRRVGDTEWRRFR